ncbi:MAG: DUF2059 domain-containing protein [Neisseria animaloris]|nr:DUF2059 domain-containing protein [Neisseria animaloris]
MKMKNKWALAATLCLAASSVWAAEASKASLEKLFEVQQFDKMLDEMNRNVPSFAKEQLQSQDWFKQIPTAKRDVVAAKINRYAEQMVKQMNTPQMRAEIRKVGIEGGAKVLTQEEVDALIKFYSSPIGKSINAKMPQYLQAVMVPMNNLMQKQLNDYQQQNAPRLKLEINQLICSKDECN